MPILTSCYTGGVKACKRCEKPVKRQGFCPACRQHRRQAQWRDASQRYRDAGKRIGVSVSQSMIDAAIKYGTEVHMIPDKPIPGKLTPRGPNEGISTTNPALQVTLYEKAEAAASDPWWEENPDAFEGL